MFTAEWQFSLRFNEFLGNGARSRRAPMLQDWFLETMEKEPRDKPLTAIQNVACTIIHTMSELAKSGKYCFCESKGRMQESKNGHLIKVMRAVFG